MLGRPELIADHLANYAALIREESTLAGRALIKRALAGVIAAVSAMLALGLIGIAVMLGVLHGSFHWVLVVVPGVAVVVAALSAWVATRPTDLNAFQDLSAQLDADVRALHLAGDSDAD
ncbi:MAG: hypothetical protein ABJA77_08515 [Variovorax sp.]